MNIIIVGAGKIGSALAKYLSVEGHSITVIERNSERVSRLSTSLDIMTVCASVDIDSLRLARAEEADLLIAATNSDESNILCCMVESSEKRMAVEVTSTCERPAPLTREEEEKFIRS